MWSSDYLPVPISIPFTPGAPSPTFPFSPLPLHMRGSTRIHDIFIMSYASSVLPFVTPFSLQNVSSCLSSPPGG